ncbi:acetamidase [Thermocladium modestius]|uniref:Acetamidase n=1 Tax=Thermocladium modestius TaxID=62609 RepID=A0A830GTW2_9CREN|nr:acetamidase/formamidase family protein [Thermocladium modestius]GGP20774.1 acetamidase [Thermocladium modestius]
MIVIDGTREENLHYKWRPDLKPIARVGDGEKFKVIIPDASTMQVRPGMGAEDLARADSTKFDAAVGPIYVEGAKPGDVLAVDILDMQVGDWGWSAILSFMGLLKGRFKDLLVHWRIGDGRAQAVGGFLRGIRVPVKPFLGVVGVAPGEGEFGMIPPQSFGGNMDNRLHGVGARIYLPVSVEGALLSLADPHASQGDGEVSGTAIETSASVVVRASVVKGLRVGRPFTMAPSRDEPGEVIATMGISSDLHRAAVEALEDMLAILGKWYGLTPEEGYVLSSVVGNLRISEIVDEPNYVVTLTMPKSIGEWMGNPR